MSSSMAFTFRACIVAGRLLRFGYATAPVFGASRFSTYPKRDTSVGAPRRGRVSGDCRRPRRDSRLGTSRRFSGISSGSGETQNGRNRCRPTTRHAGSAPSSVTSYALFACALRCSLSGSNPANAIGFRALNDYDTRIIRAFAVTRHTTVDSPRITAPSRIYLFVIIGAPPVFSYSLRIVATIAESPPRSSSFKRLSATTHH